MGFKKPENSLNFILFCIILFFGISELLFVTNFVHIPVRGSYSFLVDNPDYVYGFDYSYYYDVSYPDFWVIDFGGDHKITNIENIIIFVLMLWGFMRVIDLLRFLENYKNDDDIKQGLGEK